MKQTESLDSCFTPHKSLTLCQQFSVLKYTPVTSGNEMTPDFTSSIRLGLHTHHRPGARPATYRLVWIGKRKAGS